MSSLAYNCIMGDFEGREKIVVIFDIDKTITEKSMEEYIISDFDIDRDEYWRKVKENDANGVPFTEAYLMPLLENAILTQPYLESVGKRIDYYRGAEDFFSGIKDMGKERNLDISIYLLSTGLYDIASSMSIADDVDGIYATELQYNEDGVVSGIKKTVEPDEKPGYIQKIAEENNIEISRVIYFGDGKTDLPAFKYVSSHGGLSVCVGDKDYGDVQVPPDYKWDIPRVILSYHIE